MDREKRKRKQKAWLLVSKVLIVAFVAAMMGVLMFIVMGYKFTEDGSVEQSGLVQVQSTPTGATVEVDGNVMLSHTNMSHLYSEGQHQIKLSKDGYDTWQNTVSLVAGRMLKLDYPRLFKLERTAEVAKELPEGLELLSFSPDRNSLLYAATDSAKWQLVSVQGDDLNTTEVDLSAILGQGAGGSKSDSEDSKESSDDTKAAKMPGQVMQLTWNNDSNRVLVRYQLEGKESYYLISLQRPAESVNLSTEFNLNFEKLVFMNNSGDQLLALEGGNLRRIQVADRQISGVLLAGVAEFAYLDHQIAYATKANEAGTRVLGLIGEGEKTGATLRITEAAAVRLELSTYLGANYLTVALDRRIATYTGALPGVDQSLEDMDLVAEAELDFAPRTLVARAEGRLVVAADGSRLAVFDGETAKYYTYTVDATEVFWLDPYLVGEVAGGVLTVRDFDGANRRQLAREVANYPAAITKNNHWLYYVSTAPGEGQTADGKALYLKRERL